MVERKAQHGPRLDTEALDTSPQHHWHDHVVVAPREHRLRQARHAGARARLARRDQQRVACRGGGWPAPDAQPDVSRHEPQADGSREGHAAFQALAAAPEPLPVPVAAADERRRGVA